MARSAKKQLSRFVHSQLNNASKTLLANIRFASIDEEVKTIVITSAAPNEGKTIVSTNLANAIATSGKSVLLVEGDMHYRSLSELLNMHTKYGIYSALSGAAPLDKVITATHVPNLYFLDAEPNIPSPSDILSTKRCEMMIAKLREMFDYVIFDTPPVSLFVDAAILSSMADGTLFVVRQNATKRALAAKSVQQLNVANARILGVVTTFVTDDESQYYYAYYTQEGKRVNKEEPRRSSRQPEPDSFFSALPGAGGGAGVGPNRAASSGTGGGAGSGRAAGGGQAATTGATSAQDASSGSYWTNQPHSSVAGASDASAGSATVRAGGAAAGGGVSTSGGTSTDAGASSGVVAGSTGQPDPSASNAYAPNAYKRLSPRDQRSSRYRNKRP